MIFTVAAGCLPAGTYSAVFTGIESYQDRGQQYAEGVLLRFRVTDGECAGDDATRIVSQRCTPRSNLYGFAQALAGRELMVGESVDFTEFRGVRGLIVVEQTEGGATRVATFLRAAE